MSTKILDFTQHQPLAAFKAEQDREVQEKRRLQRLKALSDVRVLTEAVSDLVADPWDEFARELARRLLCRVEKALDEGWLK